LRFVDVEPVAGERALEVHAGGRKYLVAVDLHVGIEDELDRRGIRVPDQTDRTLSRFVKLIDERRPDQLVLLGDVKHQVPFTEKWEGRKVFRLLEALSALLPVTVVSGNHDGGIEGMAPGGVEIVGSLVLSGQGARGKGHGTGTVVVRRPLPLAPCPSPLRPDCVGLVHGHAWPPEKLMECKTLVVAHTHPSVALCDERGRAATEPCWLRARFIGKQTKKHYKAPYPELVVMPAFNDLRAGQPVNEARGRLLGPLFRNGLVDVPAAKVYLTDGTFLGPVRDLLVSRSPFRGRQK